MNADGAQPKFDPVVHAHKTFDSHYYRKTFKLRIGSWYTDKLCSRCLPTGHSWRAPLRKDFGIAGRL